jgi:phenylpropionate dioxygenase-like ring-hydroxylating dioxygenase large terminal subunit
MRQMRPDMELVGTTRHEERWDAPSLLRLSVEYYAAGEKIIIPSGHFLTPETVTTTHFFVRGGHDVGADDPAFTAQMKAAVLHVFGTEDVPMVEAQQRYLGADDLMSREPAILKTDSCAVRARRIMAKRIRLEQAGASAGVAAA